MQDTQSQDRLAGALAYILFLIPILMDRKTEYTCFHMRQAFLLNVGAILCSVIPFFGAIIGFVIFVHVVFLMWKAYQWQKFTVSYIYPYAEKLINLIGMQSFFVPSK